jgi:acetyl-CoA acyltransferase 2
LCPLVSRLQVHASNAAIAESGIPKDSFDSVCIGNVISASAVDTGYIARHVSLRCGLPTEIPALTVNRLCGSGFQSVINAIQEILVGDSDVVLTGGSDSMSGAPYAVRDIRFGAKLGTDPILEDIMWAALTDRYCKTPMGVTAENLAEKYNITREEVDAFSVRFVQHYL